MTVVVPARGCPCQVSLGASSGSLGPLHQQGPLPATSCGTCRLDSHTTQTLSAWGPPSGHQRPGRHCTLSPDPAGRAQHWWSHLFRRPRNKGAMLLSGRALCDLNLQARDWSTAGNQTSRHRIRQPPAGHLAIVCARQFMHGAETLAGESSPRSRVSPTIIPLSSKTLSKVLPYSGGPPVVVFLSLRP